MESIGILTYYSVHNYGAILQAYGLQKVLQKMGYQVEFLKFDRNYDFMPLGAEKKYNLSLKSIPFLFKYLIDNGIGTFYYNYLKMNELNKFRKTNMKIANRYSDAKNDIVIIGSDEVFAIDVGVNPFFYGHNLSSPVVLSYAATFGKTKYDDINKHGCKELITSGVNKMKSVSVRDKSSFEIINKLTNIEPELVCDPVILYGYKTEIREQTVTYDKERYILLYSYDRNTNDIEDIKYIKQYAKRKNFKVYSVGYYHKWVDKNIMCSPFELINYFAKSELVITDTFHGSVISLITSVDFVTCIKGENQKVEYLLEQYGVKNRLINDYSKLEDATNEKLNYSEINQKINEERLKSLEFLKKSLV